jgi:hypothetical protein
MDYFKDGFLKITNLLSEEELTKIRSSINELLPKVNLPNGNAAWGYGSLIKDSRFNFILEKDALTHHLTGILGDKYTFNHLLINNKSKWIGPPVEWHQESSLIETFAAGYTLQDTNKFLQVYIAIDDHNIENGCLIISPGSHKDGLLEHEDIIGYNFNHKKQIKQEVLDKLNTTHPFKNIELKAGDCLIFNHLLVHGSGSNNTSEDRKSIIIQALNMDREVDKVKFEKYTSFRINYALKFFKDKIKKLTNSNMYKDFLKDDKESIK